MNGNNFKFAQCLPPGTRIALLGHPSPDYASTILSCWKNGICAVPLNPSIPPSRLASLLNLCGCKDAVTFEAGLSIPNDITVHDRSTLPQPKNNLFHDNMSPIPQPDSPTDATIIMTSGSTGSPKGVVHSLAAHCCNAMGSHHNIPFGTDDTWLVSLPFHHVSGMSLILRALLHGGNLLFPDRALAFEQSVACGGFTHISLVPTQLVRLLRDPAAIKVLRELKAVLLGGAPCPPALAKQAVGLGIPVHISYGMTEMGSQICTTARLTTGDDFYSCGKPLPMREIAVGPRNEILVRGGSLCRGYLTGNGMSDPRDADGWFHTGDTGTIDPTGNLTVTGRIDAMFISGGENIHPEEIERVIAGIQGVDCCIVVPQKHPEFGMRPVAFVHAEDGMPDAANIRAQIESTLERFKCPDAIYPWPRSIPVGTKGNRPSFITLAASFINPDRDT